MTNLIWEMENYFLPDRLSQLPSYHQEASYGKASHFSLRGFPTGPFSAHCSLGLRRAVTRAGGSNQSRQSGARRLAHHPRQNFHALRQSARSASSRSTGTQHRRNRQRGILRFGRKFRIPRAAERNL